MPQKFSLYIIIALILILTPIETQASSTPSIPVLSILNPGDSSMVTSPIQLAVQINAHTAAFIRITVFDRNNTNLARQLHPVANVAGSTHLQKEIAFEIPSERANVLLSVSIYDAYQRPIAQRSVNLMLTSSGIADIQPGDAFNEWFVLTEPIEGHSYSGNQVYITGSLIPLSTKPIHFELINESGIVIGSRQLAGNYPDETFNFSTTIPYRDISEAQEVRLVIRQAADHYLVNLHLDSILIWLAP